MGRLVIEVRYRTRPLVCRTNATRRDVVDYDRDNLVDTADVMTCP